jgi:hypothetical protein
VTIRSFVFGVALAVTAVGVSASQYPVVDMVAQKVIQKYQSSTCEQLWEARGKPKPKEEQNLIEILKYNRQMRQVFLDEVAGGEQNVRMRPGIVRSPNARFPTFIKTSALTGGVAAGSANSYAAGGATHTTVAAP